MSDLQLSFVFEMAVSFLVICSISNVAMGKGRLWVVGHAAFLGTGGVFAWGLSVWSWPGALALTVVVFLVTALLLSAAAAFLDGDRFVVVSLAAAYCAYAMGLSYFGEGVQIIPGGQSASMCGGTLVVALCCCFGLWFYLRMLARTDLDTILLVARDAPMVLRSGRVDPRPITFCVHFLSTVAVAVAGVLVVVFYGAYSPSGHAPTRCLMFFVLAPLFGTTSVLGSVAAAVLLGTLGRGVDLLLSTAFVDSAYRTVLIWAGFTGTGGASNLAAPLTQALLAAAFIIVIRVRPQGMFGATTTWIRR